MNRLSSVRQFAFNLLVLGFMCLAVEQVAYAVLIPGYLVRMLVSPVFWGCVSVGCFSGVWWMDQDDSSKGEQEDRDDNLHLPCARPYDPIWDNPLNIMHPDYIFRHAGDWL